MTKILGMESITIPKPDYGKAWGYLIGALGVVARHADKDTRQQIREALYNAAQAGCLPTTEYGSIQDWTNPDLPLSEIFNRA